MALATELSAAVTSLQKNAPPEAVESIFSANSNFQKSFNHAGVIKPGDTLPAFSLPNATGEEISSKSLLSQGPILITFYRGEWCPFCNIELRDLQAHLPAFKAKNVTLVAISPELPNNALTTSQKLSLTFQVLSDTSNTYAQKLGLLFQQPESLRSTFKQIGIDLEKSNGDDSFALPVPATILVDGEGRVRNVFAEADWTKRLETETALEWVGKL